MSNVVSFDVERAARYIERALISYIIDPADSDFQRGHLSALLTLYTEGLGKGLGDDRIALLQKQAGEAA